MEVIFYWIMICISTLLCLWLPATLLLSPITRRYYELDFNQAVLAFISRRKNGKPASQIESVPHSPELPIHESRRINLLRSSTNKKSLFTCELSANELLMVKESGFRPLGMVMGCSVIGVGYQVMRPGKNHELTELTQANYLARENTVARMKHQAKLLNADGILSIELIEHKHEWSDSLVEFIAMGTAVKGNFELYQNLEIQRPFTTRLSGQDFWALLQAGYFPLQMTMGNCVYHVAHRRMGLRVRTVEMPEYTQALYNAREHAMERMQADAQACGADGIIGALLQQKPILGSHHVFEFTCFGTAVATINEQVALKPAVVLQMR